MNQEYKSLLEKELKLYPYRKTGVRRVNGIDIDMPMIYEDVSSIMFFLLADASKAAKYINNNRVKPILIFKNTTLMAINIFNYRKSAVGAFNEFTFSIPVTVDSNFNIPILPLIFDQSFRKFGFYVVQLGASNDLGRKHIIDLWGYPTYKNNLDITLSYDEGRVFSSIKEGDEIIIEASEGFSKIADYKFEKKKFNTYFTSNNKLHHVELDTLLCSKIFFGKRDFRIEFGDHELSDLLVNFDVGKKMFSGFYPNAVEIAGEAKLI